MSGRQSAQECRGRVTGIGYEIRGFTDDYTQAQAERARKIHDPSEWCAV
jgi:hypothetical protein